MKKILSIGALFVVVAAVLVWYHIPVKMDIPAFVNPANFGKGVDNLIGDLLHIHSIQFGDNYTIENVSISMTSDDNGIWSGFIVA